VIERWRRARRPTPMQRLSELLEAASFHRGLALGAFIGAAIAGSTLWTRLREAQRASRGQAPAEAPAQESRTRNHPA
jgi:hypothetical protein